MTSVQASCQSEDLEKPQNGMFSVCDTLARTGSVNSSCGEPQAVCHFLSCCVHTSITSESQSTDKNLWKTSIWIAKIKSKKLTPE